MTDWLSAIALGTLIVFFICVFSTLIGAASGFIVGLFFTPTIMGTLARFGVDTHGLSVWQLGATLGFVGGFLSTSVHGAKAND